MAGDWIKVEVSITKKPEVWRMAGILGITPYEVVGRLLNVWAWFDAHTENGHALGVTFSLLDAEAGVTGFAEAMSVVGWLNENGSDLFLPKFDRHNGKTAKNRALSRDRKAASRTEVTQNVTDESRIVRDISVTREEKRREEEKAIAPVGAKVAKKSPATPLPDDWSIPDEWVQETKAKHPETDWAREGERFAASHKAKGNRYSNWKQAWVTWVTSPYPKTPAAGHQANGSSPGGGRRAL